MRLELTVYLEAEEEFPEALLDSVMPKLRISDGIQQLKKLKLKPPAPAAGPNRFVLWGATDAAGLETIVNLITKAPLD